MTDLSNPEGRGLTVTLKYGKGFEESWAVFKGAPHNVREDILNYLGVEGASVAEFTLHELVVYATSVVQGTSAVASGLGATVVGSEKASSEPADASKTDPWTQAQGASQKPSQEAPAPIYGLIQAATSVDELKRLWAEHQATGEFSDQKVMEAWKAKGKALQAGAKQGRR